MFQENQNAMSIEDYLINKFPLAIKKEDFFKSFSSSEEEIVVLKNGVGLRINLSSCLIKMMGKDVLDFLNRISSNAVLDLKPFEKKNTLFLNEKGKFIDRTTLINLENDFMLVGNTDKTKRLYSWINKFILKEDIQLQDVSEKFVLLEIIGRQTESFLTLLLGKEVVVRDLNSVRRFDVDGFTFHFFVNQENNGVLVYKILIEREKCINFIEYLLSIKSVFDLSIVGKDAYDAFRIEKGIPSFPNEINDETNPYEVNLIDEVNFKKGCYIGQEVVVRLQAYNKMQRKLVRISCEESINQETLPLLITDVAGNDAGLITTFSNSEILKGNFGLALIRNENLTTANKIFIKNNGKQTELNFSEITNRS